MKLLFFVVIITALLHLSSSDNWCSLSQQHIACNNRGKMANRTGRTVEATHQIKSILLHAHNKRRNEIAGGRLRHYEPAIRMTTIQWDDTLAEVAWYNAIRCTMKHDDERKTEKYKSVGQNLAISMQTRSYEDPLKILDEMVNGWYAEYRLTNMRVINKLPIKAKGGYGHFTQMVLDRVIRMGCAITQYIAPNPKNPRDQWHTTYLVCNYAGGQYANYRIYKSGRTASGCKSGTNRIYSNLCSINEKVSIFAYVDDYYRNK